MSLASLPFEILEKILHHLDFPTEKSGCYLHTKDKLQWFNHDILSLTAVNKRLRNILLEYIWDDISITMIEHKSFHDIRRRPSLHVGSFLSNSKGGSPYDHAFLESCITKLDRAQEFYCMFTPDFNAEGVTPPPLLSLKPFFSFFPCFSHVKTLRINSKYSASENYPPKYPRKFPEHYASTLSIVAPRITPLLETLHIRLVLSKNDQANQHLGWSLAQYAKPVKLILYLDKMLDVEDIEKFGLFPFVHELIIETSGYDQTNMLRTANLDFAHKLPVLEKLTVDPIFPEWAISLTPKTPDDLSPKNVLSEYLELCSVSNLTYLNLGNFTGVPNNFNWFPPTVKILKCNPLYLRPAEDEEAEYARFDNVESLTLVASVNTPKTARLYFRKLSEFFISNQQENMYSGPPLDIKYVQELVNLFALNKFTLKTFGTELHFDDIVELEPSFTSLKSILYKTVIAGPADSQQMEHILTRTLKNCGPTLEYITCKFDPYYRLFGFRYEPRIDYSLLCDLVQTQCPNLRYCYASVHHTACIDPNTGRIDVGYFFTGFHQSEHAKNFKISDFCFQVLSPLYLIQSAERPKQESIDSSSLKLVIDFGLLRSLISKYAN